LAIQKKKLRTEITVAQQNFYTARTSPSEKKIP
jgi:hypothetical protein